MRYLSIAIILMNMLLCFSCQQDVTPQELSDLQEKGDWQKLVDIMKNDPNPLIRARIPQYLGKMPTPEVVPALIDALKHPETVNFAVKALVDRNAKEAIPDIVLAFDGPTSDKRLFIAEIARFCPETQPFLLQKLQDTSWIIRHSIILSLADYGNIESISSLKALVKVTQKLDTPNPTEADIAYMDFMRDEIYKTIGKIQFRHQLSSVDNLISYGWKKKDSKTNKYYIPFRVYFKETRYIQAYQSEWYIPDLTEFSFVEMVEPSVEIYYRGRGSLVLNKNIGILQGFYTPRGQDFNNDSWFKMEMTVSELVCDWDNQKKIYFIVITDLPNRKKKATTLVANKIQDMVLEIQKK